MKRSKATMLAAVVTVALALALKLSTAYEITACPRVDGYIAYADMGVTRSTEADMYDTLEEAKVACDDDSSCWSFNNNLEVYSVTDVALGAAPGVCTYVKNVCPTYPGYKLLPPGFVADLGDTAVVVQYNSDDDLPLECWNSDLDICAGFDITGRMIFPKQGYGVKDVVWKADNITTLCAYQTQDTAICPNKFGFFTHYDSILKPGQGLDGVNYGQLETLEDAEAYCKITPKCSGFSSDGSFTVGGIKGLSFAYYTCTYIKHPCPPVNGYTAVDGYTIKAFSPSASYPKLCFADLVRKCNDDPNCQSFDTLRNVWNIDVVQYHPFPGMCLYVKAQGFFGRISRRRALGEKVVSVVSEP
ncbi:hypothetical protein VaNZ11_008688 [Volvox africanus]|uniref:Uncharacterized protein n=1 Tax=Volvox africanus TaxID=51714 RepID=A0ABQ5S6Y2_9CHLO|nr:hypothetical protein VaNZ11_008688 [Volvox africanus]